MTLTKDFFMHARFALILVAITASPAAFAASDEAVAVVMASDTSTLNVPTVGFYQSVNKAFKLTKHWQLAPQSELQRYLPHPKGKQALLSLPSLNRDELIKAHPPAKLAHDGKTGGKAPKNRLMPSLQVMLDTLALQGAVVVDCVPQTSRRVSSCGLFYYDRAQGKVVASARKHFRVGISDATRWSEQLVDSLTAGIKSVKASAAQSQIERLLAKDGEDVDEGKLFVALGIQGGSIASPADNIRFLPEGSLALGRQTDAMTLGLEVGYGNASSSDAGVATNLTSRRAGLTLGLSTKALDNMLWELDWGIGASERRLEERTDGTVDNTLVYREAYLSVRPGMLFEVGGGWQLGAQFGATRFLGGSRRGEGDYAAATLSPTSFNIAFKIRKSF